MTDEGQRSPAWPALACAAVAILLFVPTIGFGFVYDDHRFVEGNAALADPTILWRAFTDPATQTADGTHAGLWRPLRTLSFAMDRAFFGGAAWGGHLVNLLLHAAASGALVRLLQRVGAGPLAALAGGLVYAVHPVQVECVAWISSRGDLLAAGLVWAALLAERPGRSWGAWALGAAALLAKEQAIVWPVLAFLVVLLRGERPSAALRRAAVPAGIVLVFLAVRHGLLDEPLQEGGVGDTMGLVGAAHMLAHQVWYALLPVGTTFDWQMGDVAGRGGRVLLGCVAITTVGLVALPRTRVVAAWFLAALVPTLFVQLVVPLNIRVADRFLLFALPALALAVARLAGRSPRALGATAVATLCLATLTLQAQPAWATDRALWSSVVERSPGHWRGHAWLGVTSLRAGDVDQAVEHLQHAVELAPNDGKTRFRLAEALEMQAARTEGDGVVDATRRAREAYAAAINRFARGRQENRAILEPLAQLRSVDLTLALGDINTTAAVLTAWIDHGRPEIPAAGVPLWNRDLARLTEHVAQHLDPQLERPLAPYLREWIIQQ